MKVMSMSEGLVKFESLDEVYALEGLSPAVVIGFDIAPLWLKLSAEVPHKVSFGILVESFDHALTTLEHVLVCPSVRISWAHTPLGNVKQIASEWSLHVNRTV